MRARMVIGALLGAAAALVLVGCGLLLFTPDSFGWYAYAPVSGDSFYPLTPDRARGASCAILGLFVIVGVLCWVLGRRAGRRDQQLDSDR